MPNVLVGILVNFLAGKFSPEKILPATLVQLQMLPHLVTSLVVQQQQALCLFVSSHMHIHPCILKLNFY